MIPRITQSPKIPTKNINTLPNNKITKTSTIKSKTTQNTIQSNNINLNPINETVKESTKPTLSERTTESPTKQLEIAQTFTTATAKNIIKKKKEDN